MQRICTLKDVEDGEKLGSPPLNRYPPSRAEIEEQLVRANQDCETAIDCGNRLLARCKVLYKENRRIQDKQKKYTLLFKQLTESNTELKSLVVNERKSHAELEAKYLEEIKSLKSELENVQELSERNLKSKDSFISCLWGYLRGQQAEMELLHFKHSASRCGSPQSQGEASHELTVIGDKQPKEGGKEGPEAEPTIPADSLILNEPEPETHNPSSPLPSIAVLGAGKVLAGDYSSQSYFATHMI
ncbi:hypothetical protein C1646_776384 [Rhizophagus diaphanus]|nr:hypothetical protein C1646_776384 [Rhizophagus diaphanus] [Rhizophagus sp. MUCL 43196]